MESRRRSPAEWVTFAVACVVLLVLVALIVSQVGARNGPAAPTAVVDGPVREVGGAFQVPVRIENEGGDPASEIQVQAELTVGGETTSADQTIDYLGSGADEDLVFVFDEDPASGELVVRVTGYATP
jgi:uncharacterized protein (TIGR02588 family)